MKLDAQLLGAAGRVVVRADPNCTEARITLSTADQSGPAADAVRDATLESSPDGTVTASAQQRQSGISVVQSGPQPGAGNIVGDGYVVHNGNVVSSYYTNSPNGSSVSVVSHSGSGSIVAGRIDNLSFNNGNIQIGSIEGGAFVIGQAASPIEMEVIVPEGSSVECSTDSANLETHGKVDVVEAKSATGSVSVEQATEARIETDTGNVDVQSAGAVQAESDTGNVTVQEARTVRAESDTGNVTVGNAETVRAESDTGNVTVRNADKVNARSDTGAINIGTSKDATARSKTGAVSITDARGTAKASSGIGPVSVHATEGGKVTASSALRPVTVTASDKAVSDGLTVKAEGPPGQVRTPEGANTGTSTAAGSDGSRSFNDANRADRSRDAGTARD
ncbi:MAG TPA: hypothetical protein VG497_31880 [Kribbella sp.]|nr:hypothetical protein [Kribbella sp.]